MRLLLAILLRRLVGRRIGVEHTVASSSLEVAPSVQVL